MTDDERDAEFDQFMQSLVDRTDLSGIVSSLACSEVVSDVEDSCTQTTEEQFVSSADMESSRYAKRIRRSGTNCCQVMRDATLPLGITWEGFTSGLIPILEDQISGVIHYVGYTHSGYFWCFNFTGPCPLHNGRIHDGGARIWQLKIKKGNDGYSAFKCWKEDKFKKIPFGIPEIETL